MLASVRARSTSSSNSRRASRYTSEKITTGILPDPFGRVAVTCTAGHEMELRFSAPTGQSYDTIVWLYNALVDKQKPSPDYFIPTAAVVGTQANITTVSAAK